MKKTILIFFLLLASIATQAQVDTETPGSANNDPDNADILTVAVDNTPTINVAAMSTSNDIDYFRITTNAKGVLAITVTGMNNNMKGRVELQLVNTGGVRICRGYTGASIAGLDLPPFEILTDFTGSSGIYYIKITNEKTTTNSSPYTLSIALDTVGREYNNTSGLALVSVPVSKDSLNPTALTGKIRGYLNPSNCNFANMDTDVDYYNFNPGSKRGVIVMKLDNTSNLKLKLTVYDQDGITCKGYKQASQAGDPISFEILFPTTNRFYIKVENADGDENTSPDPYSLKVWMDTVGQEYNNTAGLVTSSVPVSQNSLNQTTFKGKIRGYFNPSNCNFGNMETDVDYYNLNPGPKKGVIVMKLKTDALNLKLKLTVYDQDGTTCKGYKQASQSGDSIQFEVLFPTTNRFYIKVENADGDENTSPELYTLKVWMDTVGQEPNDDAGLVLVSNPVSKDSLNPTTIRGKIRGYFNPSNCNFGNMSTDVDYYNFNPGSKRGVIVMKLDNTSNLKLKLTVYDQDGITCKGYMQASQAGDPISFEILFPTTNRFYIKVENADGDENTSPDPYSLKVWMDTVGREYNNTVDLSALVPVNQEFKGKIRGLLNPSNCSFGNMITDVDYYKPDSCGGVFERIVLKPVPSNLKLKITAYNLTGTTEVGFRTASNVGDTVELKNTDITLGAIPKFFKIEDVNGIVSPNTYTLFMKYNNCTITGNDPVFSKQELNLFPNPTTGFLNIHQNQSIEYLWITDAVGRVQMRQSGPSSEINVQHLVGGIYWIHVKTTEGLVRQKLVKQ